MKKVLFIFSIILALANTGNAQIRTSVSNLLRYGNGERSLGSLKNNFQYFENLTDVRFSLPQNVTVGFTIFIRRSTRNWCSLSGYFKKIC